MKTCPTCKRTLGDGPSGYFTYRRHWAAPVQQQSECIECFERSPAAKDLIPPVARDKQTW